MIGRKVFLKLLAGFTLVAVIMLTTNLSAIAEENQDNGTNWVNDLLGFVQTVHQGINQVGTAMSTTSAYLNVGSQIAGLFGGGFQQIEDLIVQGPPTPEEMVASVPAASVDGGAPLGDADLAFLDQLNQYRSLAEQEEQALTVLEADPDNEALKEVYNNVLELRIDLKNTILAELKYDIDNGVWEKFHILVEHVSTQGDLTSAFYLEILNETEAKLKLELIEAEKMNMGMEAQIIEGKLQIVFTISDKVASDTESEE